MWAWIGMTVPMIQSTGNATLGSPIKATGASPNKIIFVKWWTLVPISPLSASLDEIQGVEQQQQQQQQQQQVSQSQRAQKNKKKITI